MQYASPFEQIWILNKILISLNKTEFNVPEQERPSTTNPSLQVQL